MAQLDGPATRAEIAARTGMPRSTVYALCDVLIARRWLEEVEGGLRLGPTAAFLSSHYLSERGFDQMARDVLARLALETGTLVELDLVEDGLHVVALSEGSMAQGYIGPIEGARLPLEPTAAARVMLAPFPDAIIAQKYAQAALLDVAGRPVALEDFIAQVARCRTEGYTSVTGWFDGTVSTLARPVHDPAGRTVASLCLLVHTRELQARQGFYLDHLAAGAAALSQILGRLSWRYGERCWHQLQLAMHPPGLNWDDVRAES